MWPHLENVSWARESRGSSGGDQPRRKLREPPWCRVCRCEYQNSSSTSTSTSMMSECKQYPKKVKKSAKSSSGCRPGEANRLATVQDAASLPSNTWPPQATVNAGCVLQRPLHRFKHGHTGANQSGTCPSWPALRSIARATVGTAPDQSANTPSSRPTRPRAETTDE